MKIDYKTAIIACAVSVVAILAFGYLFKSGRTVVPQPDYAQPQLRVLQNAK